MASPPFLLVMLGGALIAAQGPIYVRMAGALGGTLPAAVLAFAMGTLSLCIVMLVIGTPLPTRSSIAAVPLWVWFGGLIGAFVVVVSIHAVPRIGVAGYAVFVIAGQLAASYLYDRSSVFGGPARAFSHVNEIGLVIVLIGAVLATLRA